MADESNIAIENLIIDLMISMLYSGVSDHGFELQLYQTKDFNWYLLLLHQAHSTNQKEQRLVG